MEKPIHFINTQGEKIAGTLHLPATHTDRGIILAHCFTCSRHTTILRQLGQDFAKAGFMALRFDFSGNGQSEGEFSQSTFTKQTSEIKMAWDLLSAHGVRRIGLAGHSMGAVISLLAASEIKTVKAVCTIAGRLSGDRPANFFTREQKNEFAKTGKVEFISRGRPLMLTQDFFSDADQFDLPGIIAKLKVPLLIVHGDKDDIISVDEAYKAHKLNAENIDLTIIPGADHMFSDKDHRADVAEQIVAWFIHRPALANRNS